MYPQPELVRLAAQKAALRRHIAARRTLCVEAAARVARPLAWIDRARALLSQLSPLAKIASAPLGLLAARALPRQKLLGTLLRWAPAVFTAVRAFRSTGGSVRR